MIELRPHIGRSPQIGGGFREVTLPQDKIFVDGRHVGYVSHNPGAGLALIGRLPEAVIGDIRRHVDEVRGENEPERRASFPPELPEDEEHDDD